MLCFVIINRILLNLFGVWIDQTTALCSRLQMTFKWNATRAQPSDTEKKYYSMSLAHPHGSGAEPSQAEPSAARIHPGPDSCKRASPEICSQCKMWPLSFSGWFRFLVRKLRNGTTVDHFKSVFSCCCFCVCVCVCGRCLCARVGMHACTRVQNTKSCGLVQTHKKSSDQMVSVSFVVMPPFVGRQAAYNYGKCYYLLATPPPPKPPPPPPPLPSHPPAPSHCKMVDC